MSVTISYVDSVGRHARPLSGDTATLPVAIPGLQRRYFVQGATLTVTAAAADVIRIGSSVTATGGSIVGHGIGSTVTLDAVEAGVWWASGIVGPWDPRPEPILHAATHESGGDDEIRLDQLGAPTASVAFNGQQATSLRIENRTSDPGAPTVGQVWLRTDL